MNRAPPGGSAPVSGPGAAPSCTSCGAPDNGEFVICRFCKQAVSAEAQRTAIPCPHCRLLCRWGKQKCGSCQAWLVVSCLFCGSLSPHNVSNCMRCHEAFAGAQQRLAQRQQQVHARQQNQQLGNVAAIMVAASTFRSSCGSCGGISVSTFEVFESSSFDFGFD